MIPAGTNSPPTEVYYANVQFSVLQNTDDNLCKCAVLRVIQKTGNNKRQRIQKAQQRMDNPETPATLETRHRTRQTKQKTA